jgi:hypothetical protein
VCEVGERVAFEQQTERAGRVRQVLVVVIHRQRVLKLRLVGGGVRAPGMLAVQVEGVPGEIAVELMRLARPFNRRERRGSRDSSILRVLCVLRGEVVQHGENCIGTVQPAAGGSGYRGFPGR